MSRFEEYTLKDSLPEDFGNETLGEEDSLVDATSVCPECGEVIAFRDDVEHLAGLERRYDGRYENDQPCVRCWQAEELLQQRIAQLREERRGPDYTEQTTPTWRAPRLGRQS